MHPWSEFVLTVALAGGVACATGLNCPATCTATVDGSSWPCRYHSNECKVNATLNPSRIDVVDLNVAVINPYSGGLGELMTMVEPSVAQAIQDIENSAFLPGYRLNAYVSDSKCTAPDAISASLVAMTTAPKKHVVLSDSCSAACEAVNDAIRQFNVLQVGPGCVSVSLSDRDRYPYFTRMAPSLRFNVITLYELFKFLGVHRVGIIYGYRNINNLVKDLFLEMMAVDNAAGTYSWTPLYTQRVESIEDAESAAQMARSKDARINFMALYELEGSMVLCQAYKKNMLTPEFNWFVATGWWNENFILLAANTAESPCTESELHRASFGLIGVDRGPMLNTNVVHSLSGRTLSDLYHDYTVGCEGFGNGKGVCSHQWAGYFYDGMWLIAQVLHNYLIDQNRLALHVDFQGQTGRVRLFNSVEPKTSPPSHGDRDGIVLLRQVTGAPAEAFVQLAFRTEDEDGRTIRRERSSDTKEMTPCSGATCDFGTYRPKDRSSSCPAGEVWSMEVECSVCLPGTFAPLEKSSSCLQCAEGQETLVLCCLVLCNKQNGCEGILLTGSGWPGVGSYADQMQATECRKCPRGTYAPTCSGLRLFFSVIGFRFNMTLPWNRLFVCGGHR
ncbi:Gamma-aminobutyric acid type B receptor subunit 2 (GABA-B receptor 2) (GABA-B-R2) (GABA-BR2) (GABABR2) (Gb2) (G-protein coupled receptor 51) [Durusdinium trenchii]|uniref:Gamma-aminobutyric acid type B receptor subunit 2 (GABA-B receptor 2) (GABA-B-R2) (GABA-BR2) (GABABR2) (Gb2) (G-protein coupled receptor 51) n=1 Tax=Durusdinium trenchii TaxID=1381693 RepID=A0ABP0IRT1_9DINO